MYCKNCGKEIEEVKFCPFCGAEQAATQTTQQGYEPMNEKEYYQQQPYHAQGYNNPDDESSIGFAILSFFVPIIGLVLYLIWNKEYPKKAKSCLNGLITGVVLYIVGVCCVISAGVGVASQGYDSIDNTDWNFNAIVEIVPYD